MRLKMPVLAKKEFGPVTWFILPQFLMVAGMAYIIYVLLFIELFKSYRGRLSQSTLILLIFLGVQFAIGIDFQVTTSEFRSAIMELVGIALLVIGPPILSDSESRKIDPNRRGSFLIASFYVVLIFIEINNPKAVVEGFYQISCLSFIYYFSGHTNRGWLYPILVFGLSGARTATVSWIVFQTSKFLNQRFWRLFTFALVPLLFLLLIGSADWLTHLQETGTHLKGRTGFWLNLISNSPISFFGMGSGYSVDTTTQYLGIYQLPHNDYLRVIYDYGILGAIIFCRAFYVMGIGRNLYAFMFAAFCITGNPLTFPSAVTGLVMSNKFSSK